MFLWTLIAILTMSDGQFTGDGTFYGQGGAGKNGACMLDRGFNNVGVTVALASDQFAGGSSCGKCVKIWGDGEGLGMTPIKGPIFATVDNHCPECKSGDIDIGLGGDGRWKVHWDYVDCAQAVTNGQNGQNGHLRIRSMV